MTADVLPSDITGSSVFNQQTSEFEFRPGPIFTQLLLADEINRATPRTQSALLEAMEERQVTIDGSTRALPHPFFVLATENPIELEGTFPLPEAQLDRFLLRVTLGYPSLTDEHAILRRFEGGAADKISSAVDEGQVLAWQQRRGQVIVSEDIRTYLLEVVRSTRNDDRIQLGASPRAALGLHRSVQARALLRGRTFAIPDDVKSLAVPVLAHRLILSASARLRGFAADAIILEKLEQIAVPVEDDVILDCTPT
jgi:MoxR-like ATPase